MVWKRLFVSGQQYSKEAFLVCASSLWPSLLQWLVICSKSEGHRAVYNTTTALRELDVLTAAAYGLMHKACDC